MWQECLFRNQTISSVGRRRERDDIGWGLITTRDATLPTASQGRELRERSRARRTSTPARSRPVVSLGRSTTAESRGRRWTRENETRGRQTLAPGRGGRPGQRWRTGTKTGRASRREEEAPVGRKEPASSVSYVVSVESDGNRESLGVIGAHGVAPEEGGHESGTTRAFSCPLSVCAPRSIRALSCSPSRGILPQSV